MATLDNIYLYGELNNYVEYLRYKLKNTDTASLYEDDEHNLSVDVNVQDLVRLLQVKNDSHPEDDVIKHYRLFMKNPSTGQFTIPIPGDEIVVGAGASIETNIKSIVINGIPVKGYIDEETGQMNLEAIPADSISTIGLDLDGNGNGGVY